MSLLKLLDFGIGIISVNYVRDGLSHFEQIETEKLCAMYTKHFRFHGFFHGTVKNSVNTYI